jgi:type I restriction enzyme S subunit
VNAVPEPVVPATLVVPLTDAVELNPRPDRAALADDLEVSFVPMAAVEAGSGRMDATAIRRFGEVKKGYTIFREGDVLFAKITPCMENGKMAVARGLRNGTGCGSTEFHVLRPRPGVDAHYVYHFVSSARFRAEAAHHMTGAVGQKRVPTAFLERCVIPLPHLDDQRRIVAEIEQQFSRLDEAVANLKRVKASTQRLVSSVLIEAVTGRLVPSTGPSWQTLQVCEAGDVVLGRQRAPQYLTGRWPRKYLRVANIKDDTIDFSDVETMDFDDAHFAKYQLMPGDILVSEGQSPELLGQSAIFRGFTEPLCFQKTLHRFRADPEVTTPEFAQIVFRSHVRSGVFRRLGSITTNIGHLTLEKFKAAPFSVPSLDEQRRIAAEVDRRLSIVREVEAEVDANLRRAQALRQAVLARAFHNETPFNHD